MEPPDLLIFGNCLVHSTGLACGSGCCDEADGDNADEDDEFAEMVEVLSALIHKVFGDNVSVHVLME